MRFTKKLQQVQRGISKWKKQQFGNIDEHIKIVQQKIKEVQTHPNASQDTISDLQKALQHWYTIKADISHQQSRHKLLHSQDRNTKVFHAQA
ncbi:hypothetical protein MKW92_000887, partial [Papaver armeniacum]